MHDFIITLNLAYLGRQLSSTHGTQKGYANQLMALLRIADLNEVKATEHANIRMTAEQFAEFIYLRAAGATYDYRDHLPLLRLPALVHSAGVAASAPGLGTIRNRHA